MKLKILLFILLFICTFLLCDDFQKIDFDINLYRLFDLGACDYNNDGNLDIFSSNHNAKQIILMGYGNGIFSENKLSDLKLDQDVNFSGLEVSINYPTIKQDGLYIFWYDMKIYIIFKDDFFKICKIKMSLTSEIDIIKNSFYLIDKTEIVLSSGLIKTELEVIGNGLSEIIIDPDFKAIPISFEVQGIYLLKNIFIGLNKINPSSLDFIIRLQDRHGLAWTDLNNDGKMDVFISRGGLQGKMSLFPEEYNYELFINQGDHFLNLIDSTNIEMNNVRGRQAIWVDYNRDDRVDLFLGNKESPNQLYEQQADGAFIDIASNLLLNKNKTGKCIWYDKDNDDDMDLFLVNVKGILLFENNNNVFSKYIIEEWNNDYESYNITYGDIDNDCDIDFFLTSIEGNYLIINDNEILIKTDLDDYGLPHNSVNAFFVDVDNDSYLDVDITCDGIYRQVNNVFVYYSDEISKLIPSETDMIHVIWFDANNDGTRDIIFSYEKDTYIWKTKFYLNMTNNNNWIELNLVDDNGNVLGTKTTIESGDMKLFSEVGCSENSKFSQGHYRLYFGLKDKTIIDEIKIEWLDGCITFLRNVEVNQILTIRKE